MPPMSIDPQKSQVYNEYYLKKKGWFTDGHTRLQGVVIVAPDQKGDDIKVSVDSRSGVMNVKKN